MSKVAFSKLRGNNNNKNNKSQSSLYLFLQIKRAQWRAELQRVVVHISPFFDVLPGDHKSLELDFFLLLVLPRAFDRFFVRLYFS